MEAAGRHANLRALLADDETCRNAVLEMITAIEAIDKEEVRGFRLASMLDPSLPEYANNNKMKPYKLEGDAYRLMCNMVALNAPDAEQPIPTDALSVEEISLHDVCYTTSRCINFRSSRILFRSSEFQPTREHIPGVIRDIFKYTFNVAAEEVKGLYLLVQEYPRMDVSDGRRDPYVRFGFAGGFLCQPIAERLHLLKPSQVVSHFGLTKLRGDYEGLIHCMPVDRVSFVACFCDRPDTNLYAANVIFYIQRRVFMGRRDARKRVVT